MLAHVPVYLILSFVHHNHSLERLTWHDGVIPKDEIWVKLGGDKGGGSFKMNYQLLNVPKRRGHLFGA